jgi:hypothetical protein
MKKFIIIAVLALLAMVPSAVLAQTNDTATVEVMVFDSTNNYLGACSYTDSSQWTLTQDLQVTKFQLWYYWQSGETTLPVTVTKDGAEFASFTATRGACDPYQASWCNADYAINKTFPAGTYTTKIATAYQCLKPGGTGTVRLYGTQTAVSTNSNANVVVTTNGNANANTNTNVVVTSNSNLNTNSATANINQASAETADVEYSDDSSTLTYVLIGIIVVLLVIIVVMYLKCGKKPTVQK